MYLLRSDPPPPPQTRAKAIQSTKDVTSPTHSLSPIPIYPMSYLKCSIIRISQPNIFNINLIILYVSQTTTKYDYIISFSFKTKLGSIKVAMYVNLVTLTPNWAQLKISPQSKSISLLSKTVENLFRPENIIFIIVNLSKAPLTT